jgi:hypothetical protein
VRWYVCQNDGIRPNHRVVSDSDWPEYLCTGANIDTITNHGRTSEFGPAKANGDSIPQNHVIPQRRIAADDYSVRMIDT